ncbi:hypothetical protein AB1Y20_012030 [Prymnesium parvum]|uniref:Hexosyltransferase n=1 Tax=Prymnesium parvum TaxID=97485 RepID=A0AB34IMC3_PRYPA
MHVAIGQNTPPAQLHAACPSRKYHRCFFDQLAARYPVAQFRAAHLLPGCDAASPPPRCASPFLSQHSGPPLRRCAAASPPPHPAARLKCSSAPAAVDAAGVQLLLGVPSAPSAKGAARRAAVRSSWLQDERVGTSVVVCFLLSSQTPPRELEALQEEQRAHGDILLLDAPETSFIITQNTRYSNFTKKGRGMPTFKQYAFFQHAAAFYPRIPFVGKIDDDTAPNLRLLTPLLDSLRCHSPYMFVGAINWASFVPRAAEFGVRGDRCGFGWSLGAALHNFGSSWGKPGEKSYIEACDTRGGVLPFPYGTGAGYIFSAALLKFVATSPEVTGWVAEAAGPTREELQWQKYEDTSTGYWLTYCPHRIQFIDIGPQIHDIMCHEKGERRRHGGATYRPPSNASVLVHNLKTPSAFGYAHEHMRGDEVPYDHESCTRQVYGAIRGNSARPLNPGRKRGKRRGAKQSARGGARKST